MPANALFVDGRRKPIQTLIDTTEDGYPSEAVLFGGDIKLVTYRTHSGMKWFTLNGPDGEIDLPEQCWLEIAKAIAGRSDLSPVTGPRPTRISPPASEIDAECWA